MNDTNPPSPRWLLTLLILVLLTVSNCYSEQVKDTGLQLAENPPMEVITTTPPDPVVDVPLDLRPGYTLISSIADFRASIKKDGQKIRRSPVSTASPMPIFRLGIL